MGQEPMIKIDHANEAVNRLDIGWSGELLDGRDLTGERFDAVLVDSVAEEIDFCHSELTLFKFDYQTMFLETVEKYD